MSRKPVSVVKSKLVNCTSEDGDDLDVCSSFIGIIAMVWFKKWFRFIMINDIFLDEIDGKSESTARKLESTLDYSYLFSYAFFMFVR